MKENMLNSLSRERGSKQPSVGQEYNEQHCCNADGKKITKREDSGGEVPRAV